MKKRHLLSLFLLAPAVVFFAGPRPNPDLSIDAPTPTLPDDIDEYLRASESQFNDLTPGTEKTIVWNDTSRTKTPLSIVYLHGFSASRQETAPLCDVIAEELGANLFYTRLAGHGRPGEALGAATVDDWIDDAVEALAIGRKIGDEVIVVGTSTGATLAMWVLAQPGMQRQVKANIMLSPNFAPKDRNARVALWPWGRQIMRAAVGRLRRWEARNELQERYWTTEYPVKAIVTMMTLVDQVDNTDLGLIDTPSLVLYAELDDVISVDKIKQRFPDLGATRKELVAVDTSSVSDSHVLAGDVVAPARTRSIADQIISFVESL